MDEREYLLSLYSFLPFGPKRLKLLGQFFGSYENVWKTDKKQLLKIGLKETLIDKFIIHKRTFNYENYLRRLHNHSIKYVTIEDSRYPENLKSIDSAPLVLYYIGNLHRSDVNAVAIVGSRKMSSYGREIAYKFSSELATMGIVIVSGLALGIDAVAHKACVEVGGRGLIVLASGLDTISPLSNLWLAREIVKKGGAIVSEYPLGQKPLKTSFPSRNRIISGLSKAVIVIEGLKKSGTLLTASHAAEQGRPVFAVPGQITSPLSCAPHFLIQNGAKLVTNVNEVLEEMEMELKVDFDKVEGIMPSDENEKKIIEILSGENLHLDEVARIMGLQVSEISGKLTVMELKGMVKNIGGGVYKKIS